MTPDYHINKNTLQLVVVVVVGKTNVITKLTLLYNAIEEVNIFV